MTALDLNNLLVDLAGMDTEAVECLGRQLYGELYLNKGKFGLHSTHDGERC
jgi:hypothetical protein